MTIFTLKKYMIVTYLICAVPSFFSPVILEQKIINIQLQNYKISK